MSLLPNPSHLEAVNPVALGKTRAKQFALLKTLFATDGLDGCVPGDRVMCVQMHGDASFTGQGIVMEGLGLSMVSTLRLGEHAHCCWQVTFRIIRSVALSTLL